jgi:hypothetical protein
VTPHVHFDQAPHRSWDQFEELYAEIPSRSGRTLDARTPRTRWPTPAWGRHRRKNEAIWPVGIQCKRKSVWPVSVVTTHDLDKEVEKAKEFKLTLKSSIWFRPPPAISRGKSTLV